MDTIRHSLLTAERSARTLTFCTGRDALIGFRPDLKASGITYTNHRILQDCDFVALHNSFTNAQAFGAPEIVTIDIYRMEDGMAAEHWDAIQPVVAETASGLTQWKTAKISVPLSMAKRPLPPPQHGRNAG